jgi:sialate O-acetylesterase
MKAFVLFFLVIFFWTSSKSAADVRQPSIFGDHMVLQAGQKIPFWGTAAPGEKITATIGAVSAQTEAGADGKWMVYLGPQSASTTPVTVTVAGNNTLTYRDVLLGEVWLASGQSNMQLGMTKVRNAEQEISEGSHPLLRLFCIQHTSSFSVSDDVPASNRQDDPRGHWQLCTPEMLRSDGWGGFAGTAYFFGREIQDKTRKPVGLVLCAYLGQPAEAFVSIETLKSDPEFAPYIEELDQMRKHAQADRAAYPAAKALYDEAHKAWEDQYGVEYGKALADWKAAKTTEPMPRPPVPQPNPPPDGTPKIGAPTTVYNAMIHPIIPYGIRGAIWYQGESNCDEPWCYDKLMASLIREWRTEWNQGDFPFLFVQLCTLGPTPPYPLSLQRYPLQHSGWPIVREMQTRNLSIPNTGMAVTIDLGDADLHPPDKQDVGHRLALLARRMVYKEPVECLSPMYESMALEGNKIRIRFKNGEGLKMGPHPSLADPRQQAAPPEITGFAIAGVNQKWVNAKAVIDGSSVIVWSDAAPDPAAVRYGWATAPMCYLYNGADLPVAPFRTDDWDEKPFMKPKK